MVVVLVVMVVVVVVVLLLLLLLLIPYLPSTTQRTPHRACTVFAPPRTTSNPTHSSLSHAPAPRPPCCNQRLYATRPFATRV